MTQQMQEEFAAQRRRSDRSAQVIESYDVKPQQPLYSLREMRPRRAGRAVWDGARLRELRESRGLSQGQLSDLSGVSPAELSRHERNAEDSNPTVDVIARLAGALEVPLPIVLEPVGFPIPRPMEVGSGGARERSAFLDERYKSLLESVDHDFEAEDSVEGDILKAIAALNRALRRAHRGQAPEDHQAARRRTGSGS